MGGGGGNVFENIYNEVAKKTKDITGSDVLNDVARESKPVYDELTGENARKKKAMEKKAEKKVKAAQATARAEKKKRDATAAARTGAEEGRDSALSSQSRRGKKGRRSTILTDKLGGVGGEDNQGRKSLLGY